MLLQMLKANLILLGIYVTRIHTEDVLKNQINANLQRNDGNTLATKKFDSSTISTLTLSELFPNLFLESKRKIKHNENNEISNTLHSLYSEERDLCVGYDSFRGNRVKRQKCPDNCTCKKLESINADGDDEINRRIKRDNFCTENYLQTNKEIDAVERIKRESDSTGEKFEPLKLNIEADYDLRYHMNEENSKINKSDSFTKLDSENYLDLDHLETLNSPQIEIDPVLNFRGEKCLENCINLNNIDFDGDNYLILKSENLEQAKTDETRKKREEDCKNCIIRGLIELEKSNRNKKKIKRSKCSRKEISKNKYARRQSKFESILRKFKPKTYRHCKKRPVNLCKY